MKREAERQEFRRKRTATAPAVDGAAGRISLRTRAPRCDQSKSHPFHDEAVKQVTEAVQDIVRANVEKAKAGSLTHTRWLFSLMEVSQDQERCKQGEDRKSLAEMLIRQLKEKQ